MGWLLSRSSAPALASWSLSLNCLSIFHICFLSGNSFPCAESASVPSAWPALAKGPAPLRAPDLLQTPPSLRPLTSSSCLPASAGHRAEGSTLSSPLCLFRVNPARCQPAVPKHHCPATHCSVDRPSGGFLSPSPFPDPSP